MDKAEQVLWMFLIKNGKCWKNYGRGHFDYKRDHGWDFYRGDYVQDDAARAEMLSGINEHGIDWKKTSSVHEDSEDVFNGTFDDSTYSPTYTGTLYLGNGDSYNFGVERPGMTISSVVRSLLELNVEEKTIEELLQNSVDI